MMTWEGNAADIKRSEITAQHFPHVPRVCDHLLPGGGCFVKYTSTPPDALSVGLLSRTDPACTGYLMAQGRVLDRARV